MPVDYPSSLPTVLAPKRTSKIAPFSMVQPRRGTPYVERTGTDTPTIFDVEWLLLPADAVTLRDWVEGNLLGGALPFRMPLRTEDGLRLVTGSFMPDGLLDRQREGTLWRYRATIVARDGRGEEIVAFVSTRARDSATTISNNTSTVVAFQTTAYNSGAFSSSQPTRLTVPRAGKFIADATVYFGINANGNRAISIRKNGAVVLVSLNNPSPGDNTGGYLSNTGNMSVCCIADLQPGDYLEVIALQTSGSALSLTEAYFSIAEMEVP